MSTIYYADVDAAGVRIGQGLYVSGADPTIPGTAAAVPQPLFEQLRANRDLRLAAGVAALPLPVAPPLPKPPTTISSASFFARFTAAETAAVWAAAAPGTAHGAQIGPGLMQGMALGTIDLTSPQLAGWLGLLVQAGAISLARQSQILDPAVLAPPAP